MFERFAPDARTVVVQVQEHARRLGHNFVGCEHLLLAIVSTDQPASAVLREHGVTPQHVEDEIARQVGPGVGSRLFGTLNRDALASIGIDLDTVRAKIEESFGPEALARADRAVHRESSPSRLNPRRAVPPGLVPHWRRRRRAGRAVLTAPAPTPTGRRQTPGARPTGHIPFTPRAKESLANAVREAQARHDNHIGIEHLALGLLSVNGGPVRSVLSALDASAPALRAAIVARYRKAS
ncbi:Clp protease N-terminal domain-containing protein [Streptomyces sp. NRRL F-5123]|uniref:Clp protease N-terminal domain-containing protein n=1 Tax=Streptomyces sp. NRRL F-5123 TaxID=1463856 RepID=UPI0005B79431|nr:Clp protease N-terminal domain-containing protein [Streptomyces sp. NRRL F-5123]